MSQVKRAALDVLVADFAANITGMSGRVRAMQPSAQEASQYSGIALSPGKFKLVQQQRKALTRPSSTSQLYQVARAEGPVQIRAYGKEPADREALEELVQARFYSQDGRRGGMVLTTPNLTLAGIPTLYAAPIGFTLTGEEWNEERVFDRRRYSFLDVTCSYPILITQQSVHLMTTIILHVTRDLHTAEPAVEAVAKRYGIAADATVTPLP